MSRITASERLRRLLSLIPWVASQDGPTIDEVCTRFAIERRQLVDDLTLASMVGVHPFTPDALVEVVVEEDRVWVHYPLSFDRPLRLTAAEALALLAAGQVVLQAPGADPEGPLARALGKVARSLGVDPAAQVEVQLSEASQQTFRQLDRAIQERRQVEIDYYAYNRDERSTRVIDPYRLWSNLGAWYVLGWCHRAGGERTFRLDGIVGLRALDTSFEPPTERPTTAIYEPSPDDPRVTIDLEPEASWVVEKYPVEALEQLADGRLRATLAVSAVPWLERLLLRLGPGVGLVGQSGGADLRTVGPTAARRVLARYEHS